MNRIDEENSTKNGAYIDAESELLKEINLCIEGILFVYIYV